MSDMTPGLFGEEPMQELTELGVFDYRLLSADTRVLVLEKTDETQWLLKKTAENIIKIGKNLQDVKDKLPHGMFLPWLQSEFGMSHKTAHNFMSVNQRFGNKYVNFTHLSASVLYLLASPSTPDEAIDEVIQRADSGEKITHALAKQIIDAQEAIKKAQEAEAQARADKAVAQQLLFNAQTEAEQKIGDLNNQIASLQAEIKTIETPPVQFKEVTKEVIPPDVQKKLADLQKERDRLQAEQASQNERIKKLQADVEVSIRKREFAENADRMRQDWRRITSETHSCMMRLLGQWPTPVDVQSFEADDWAQVEHLKATLKRVLAECDALHYGSSGVVEDMIIDSGLVPYALNGNR